MNKLVEKSKRKEFIWGEKAHTHFLITWKMYMINKQAGPSGFYSTHALWRDVRHSKFTSEIFCEIKECCWIV